VNIAVVRVNIISGGGGGGSSMNSME